MSKFKRVKKEKIKKVLIIHLGAIGELLVTTPLLSALKKNLDCEISFMVSKGKEDILKDNPYLSEIITYENDFKKNIENLKKKKFDLAVIISPASIKMSLICLLAGIKYRVGGFGGFKRGLGLFYTRRTFLINKKHAVERNLDIIKQIGIETQNPKLEFYSSNEEERNAKKKLKKLKVKDYIVIHPGYGFAGKHKYSPKSWPLERYAQVIDKVVETYPVKVLLTGGNNELILATKILENVKNKNKTIITNGKFNFGELGYVISKAKVLIAPSTSVTHLASALETPLVELAGKGDLYEWRPWAKEGKYIALYHNELCTGCNTMDCRKKTVECMKAISVKEVTNAVEKMISIKK